MAEMLARQACHQGWSQAQRSQATSWLDTRLRFAHEPSGEVARRQAVCAGNVHLTAFACDWSMCILPSRHLCVSTPRGLPMSCRERNSKANYCIIVAMWRPMSPASRAPALVALLVGFEPYREIVGHQVVLHPIHTKLLVVQAFRYVCSCRQGTGNWQSCRGSSSDSA